MIWDFELTNTGCNHPVAIPLRMWDVVAMSQNLQPRSSTHSCFQKHSKTILFFKAHLLEDTWAQSYSYLDLHVSVNTSHSQGIRQLDSEHCHIAKSHNVPQNFPGWFPHLPRNQWNIYTQFCPNITSWWYTYPLKNHGVCQLGWWNSQTEWKVLIHSRSKSPSRSPLVHHIQQLWPFISYKY